MHARECEGQVPGNTTEHSFQMHGDEFSMSSKCAKEGVKRHTSQCQGITKEN